MNRPYGGMFSPASTNVSQGVASDNVYNQRSLVSTWVVQWKEEGLFITGDEGWGGGGVWEEGGQTHLSMPRSLAVVDTQLAVAYCKHTKPAPNEANQREKLA